MAANTSELRQQVSRLVDQLGPDQIKAVCQLLEVMVEPGEEPLTERDKEAVTISREYFMKNPKPGVAFEEFAAEIGFTMDQIGDQAD